MKVRIRVFVIRLNRTPVFRFFFSIYYRAAWLLFSGFSRSLFPEIAGVRLHRGYASAEWEAGMSDIDPVIDIKELTPGENARFIRSWAGFYRKFRLLFPVMGEPLIASPGERELYRGWGDIRSEAKRAAGPEAVNRAKTELDLWTECFHAHTRLCKLAVSRETVPAAVAARDIRKCVLDIARHRPGETAEPRPSRTGTEDALGRIAGLPGPELQDLLLRVNKAGRTGGTKPLAQLACAHAADILERDALRFLGRHGRLVSAAPRLERYPSTPEEDAAAFYLLPFLKKELGGSFGAAVLDNVFNSVIVLNDIPGEPAELAKTVAALDSAAGRSPALRGPLFPLGPASLGLMGACPYDDDPLKMACPAVLDRDKDAAVCLQSGEHPHFAFHRRTFLGAGAARLAPRPPLLEPLYREALAHFLRTWRGLLPPGRAGAVYVVSRTLSLWLYFLRGIACPCFPLQGLVETFRREGGPAELSWLEAGLMNGLGPGALEALSAVNIKTLQAAGTIPARSGGRHK